MTMLISIVFLPLYAAIVLGLFGRNIGRLGAHVLGPLFTGVALIGSLLALKNMMQTGDYTYLFLGTWFRCSDLSVGWGFCFDSLSIPMFVVVTLVSFCVQVYSVDYMGADPNFVRFMSFLSMFTFFMLFLVSADNLVHMFVGWEGVGVCSFLLVSFWFSRPQAVKAALKALIFNRVGDCGLIVGIILIFRHCRTVRFDTLFLIIPYLKEYTIALTFFEYTFNIKYLSICAGFLLFGVIGKSAQIGLHCWLPEAMEGPTPVSALIHAATMVTAGVFLVLRCSFIFDCCPDILLLIVFFGGLTVFFASVVCLTQYDIKKIIAYSTCSQLGYMLVACGCGNYSGAFFHLVNHAFIKALLFLTAGVIISKTAGEQDIRKLGGLQRIMPLTYVFMLIGSMSLAGFPFLSGYFSKDLLIEVLNVRSAFAFVSVYWFVSISTLLTSFYSFRMLFLIFIMKTRMPFSVLYQVRDVSVFVSLPLIVLSLLSIFSGFFLYDIFLGMGTAFFVGVFPCNFKRDYLLVETIPVYLKMLPTLFSFLGCFLGMNFDRIYYGGTRRIIVSRNINCAFNFDSLYNRGLVYPLCRFALVFCFRLVDKYFLEAFGPKGLVFIIKALVFNQASITSGKAERLFFLTLYAIILCFLFVWFFL